MLQSWTKRLWRCFFMADDYISWILLSTKWLHPFPLVQCCCLKWRQQSYSHASSVHQHKPGEGGRIFGGYFRDCATLFVFNVFVRVILSMIVCYAMLCYAIIWYDMVLFHMLCFTMAWMGTFFHSVIKHWLSLSSYRMQFGASSHYNHGCNWILHQFWMWNRSETLVIRSTVQNYTFFDVQNVSCFKKNFTHWIFWQTDSLYTSLKD
jgi:hypothetical protein